MFWKRNLSLTSHKIEFTPDSGIGPELKCPRCQSNYMHHGRVTVFDRGEDADLTAITAVQDGLSATHIFSSKEVSNPSGRRHGIAIAFDCEQCGDDIELTIAQHKGNTVFAWRFDPAKPHRS